MITKSNYLIANGVIVPPCKLGERIWVIDREDGEPVDISCVQFLAKSKGFIIATAWINDYDLDETLEYHINNTQNNREEAEKALERRANNDTRIKNIT